MTYYNMLNRVRPTVGGLDEVYFTNIRYEGTMEHQSKHEFTGPEAVNEFKRFVDSFPVPFGIRKGCWEVNTFGCIDMNTNQSGTRYDITVSWNQAIPTSTAENIVSNSVVNSVKPVDTVISACIKNVIFNPPATIVFWKDGTKTVVKCEGNDIYDPEKGLAMAISKKMLGNKYDYYNNFKHWLKKCYLW